MEAIALMFIAVIGSALVGMAVYTEKRLHRAVYSACAAFEIMVLYVASIIIY